MVCFFLSLPKRKIPQRCPKQGGGDEGHFWKISKSKQLFLRDYFPKSAREQRTRLSDARPAWRTGPFFRILIGTSTLHIGCLVYHGTIERDVQTNNCLAYFHEK